MSTIERFEDIEAWQTARQLTKRVYEFTAAGDFSRDFGLRDQMRRAAVSIRRLSGCSRMFRWK
jgi:hypothetical protein